MLRNKCVKLVRRDRMQTAMKKMSESSNKEAAAWRLADSTLKRGGVNSFQPSQVFHPNVIRAPSFADNPCDIVYDDLELFPPDGLGIALRQAYF